MMRFLSRFLCASLVGLLLLGCDSGETFPAYDNTEERSVFYQRYNKTSTDEAQKNLVKLQAELGKATEEIQRGDLQRRIKLLEKRLADGPYFQWKEEADLPANLNWTTNLEDPDIGSPNAKKGGTYKAFIPGLAYPPTLRCVGKGGNNNFRSYHWNNIELGLVGGHPNTGNIIPSLADRWAVAEDMQTVYFHIDDRAKWSDGDEVVVDDFFMAFYVYLSPYLTEQFYRTYYGEQFSGITAYGKNYLAIRLANPKPKTAFFANQLPFQAKFYKAFGPDFEERYNWLPRPTTGAYKILPEDIKKGRAITLTRVKDWWAKDLKYYRYIFNPDRIEYKLIRDREKIFVLFKRGEIDVFPVINDMKYWYEKTEIPEVFHGYIEKATFYNDYPRPPYGLYFNQAHAQLANLDLRIGLQHATHWERVIKFDMRGDSNRLHILNDGFGSFSNSEIVTRPFSPKLAAEAFARAGYTKKDAKGIWMNDDGQKLSFTISYTKAPLLDQIMQRLKEEALKAGVEYKLEGQDGTANYQMVAQKKHQIAFTAWGITPPFPDYYEFFHSKEAYEPGTKTPRSMTNNIFTYADPAVMDPLLEANRNATTEEEIRETSYAIEEKIHNEALWSPGWKKDTYRSAHWRWIQWPDDFNVKISDEPEMSYVFWIDEDIKKETKEAIRDQKTFPEVNRVYDKYRIKMGAEP